MSIEAFVEGVTAAAAGSLAGVGFVLGKRALYDAPTVLICLVTLVVTVSSRRRREMKSTRALARRG